MNEELIKKYIKHHSSQGHFDVLFLVVFWRQNPRRFDKKDTAFSSLKSSSLQSREPVKFQAYLLRRQFCDSFQNKSKLIPVSTRITVDKHVQMHRPSVHVGTTLKSYKILDKKWVRPKSAPRGLFNFWPRQPSFEIVNIFFNEQTITTKHLFASKRRKFYFALESLKNLSIFPKTPELCNTSNFCRISPIFICHILFPKA